MRNGRFWLHAYVFLTFVTVLAGDAWRYSITWFGWGGLVVVLTAIGVVIFVRSGAFRELRSVPFWLAGFLLLAVLSILWSDYRPWTAVAAVLLLATALVGVTITLTLTGDELRSLLGHALRFVLAASLGFEAAIAVFVRHPIVPWWTNYSGLKIHAADYWSRDVLLSGGQVQGIMGNSNLLGFVAMLGVIVFGLEVSTRKTPRVLSWSSLAVAVVCVLLTRSATVTIALAIVALGLIAILFIGHARTTSALISRAVGTVVVVLAVAIVAILSRFEITHILNKSPDFTGRFKVWANVYALAVERPVFGWGWISYWVPFVSPFTKLASNGGVQLLQAHDAWLDVWFQLGLVGVAILLLLVGVTSYLAWRFALADRVAPTVRSLIDRSFYFLLLLALIAQSLTESRLLIEYGMLLLVVVAVSLKKLRVSWSSSTSNLGSGPSGTATVPRMK